MRDARRVNNQTVVMQWHPIKKRPMDEDERKEKSLSGKCLMSLKGAKMRPIDADALKEAMYHEAFETDSDMQKWDSGCWIRYKMFENAIEAAPTIDAVPVVRCKDCKYRPIDTGTHQYGHELEFPNEYKCPCQCDDHWYSWMPDDEWFCANGERRTDEQT